ncbi:MAG: Cu(I)-responsive transcriptional regulator [Proteobacteria bacterium]|nr:Cu(I)-responsive transcriptional regulator [Pseudomonadota bacterium]
MNIGIAAERSSVPPKTIRYYESIGLIRRANRRNNNYRDYSNHDVQTLRFIHRARGLGFTVREVGELLALWFDKKRASYQVKTVALRHITEIDGKLAELQGMRRVLVDLTERCHGDTHPECPILDDLARGDAPGVVGGAPHNKTPGAHGFS